MEKMDNQNSAVCQNKAYKLKQTLQLPFYIQKAPIDNLIAYQKKGHWTEKEKLKYIFFLQFFKEKFTTRNNKRFCRIFKVMSDFIKTRTHNQCRSHHQKMEKEKYEVDSIIQNVSSKYHPRVFRQLYEKYELEMMNLDLQDIDEPLVKTRPQKSKKQFCLARSQTARQTSNCKNILKKQNMMENIKIKQNREVKQEYNHFQPTWNPLKSNKVLKPTDIQYRDQEEEVDNDVPFLYDIPIGQPIQRQFKKSLDYQNHQSSKSFTMDIVNMKCPLEQKLQILQSQRYECINRANFHYSQMQKSFHMAQQIQRQKLLALFEQRDYQREYPLKKSGGMPPMPWNYANSNQI